MQMVQILVCLRKTNKHTQVAKKITESSSWKNIQQLKEQAQKALGIILFETHLKCEILYFNFKWQIKMQQVQCSTTD